MVTRLGKRAQKSLYRELATQGSVRARDDKALGIFPLVRHDVLDGTRRDDLLRRIRAALLHDQPADDETGPLIGLLAAGELVKIVVDKPDRERVKKRAEVIAEGDWASEGVRQAIQAARSAMMAATVAGAAAGTAGSS